MSFLIGKMHVIKFKFSSCKIIIYFNIKLILNYFIKSVLKFFRFHILDRILYLRQFYFLRTFFFSKAYFLSSQLRNIDAIVSFFVPLIHTFWLFFKYAQKELQKYFFFGQNNGFYIRSTIRILYNELTVFVS